MVSENRIIFTSLSLKIRMIPDVVAGNTKIRFPVTEPTGSHLVAKLRYWWSWLVAGSLLLFIATPALIFLWIINRQVVAISARAIGVPGFGCGRVVPG